MDVTAYLDRIGLTAPARPGPEQLRLMHRAHQTAVPFENLAIHLGEPISLTADALFDKIVRRRRGGFCYELNGAFALVLEALGYRVTRLAARVFGGRGLGPVFDHLTLVVDGGWLVDVGFGRHSTYPLRFAAGASTVDPAGRYTMVATADGDIDVVRDGEPQYRVELRPRDLADFGPTCWYQQTSPASHFTRSVICSRLDGEAGRVSISGRTLIRTGTDGRTETTLGDDDAVLAAYRDEFGLELPAVPSVGSGVSPG